MSDLQTIDILCLRTTLFSDNGDVLAATETIDNISLKTLELHPGQMGDADWDAVVEHVLRANKVITL